MTGIESASAYVCMHVTVSAICKFFVFRLQPNYQSSFAPSAPPQPSVLSLFTPQQVPVMSMTPHHVVPPHTSPGPQTSVYSRGPPYPQYNLGLAPATVSGPGKHCLTVMSILQVFLDKSLQPGWLLYFLTHKPIVLAKNKSSV